MVIRYFLLAIVLWLLFSGIRRLARQRKERIKKAQSGRSVNMVACNHCGIHLPQKEAIYKNESYYCCKEHSRLSGEEEQE